MSAFRTAKSSTGTISFSFDGKTVSAVEGDTIASALLAADIKIVGRSFKYHRPRGIWGFGVEEPNAIVDVTVDGRTVANLRATTELAKEGMIVRSVNSSGSAENDRYGLIDRMARFIPAAFYYKTFIWPDWHVFEPRIRAMAGLGRLDPDWRSDQKADHINDHVDVLVIGGGPAGLAAGIELSKAGRKVWLVEEHSTIGRSLMARNQGATIDGMDVTSYLSHATTVIAQAGGRVMTRTTAFGLYDHNLVALCQRHDDGGPDSLHRIRVGQIVLASGAIERPLPFAANDLPGIMSADAALSYLRHHGICPGETIVIATNNSSTRVVAEALRDAGVRVTIVDSRDKTSVPDGVNLIAGRRVVTANGRKAVTGVTLDDGTILPCDSLLVSGGFTPTIHLFGQAQGKLRFDETIQGFVPETKLATMHVAGSANGKFSLAETIADGQAAASRISGVDAKPAQVDADEPDYAISAQWPVPGQKGRVWIDFQNDVTAKDVEIAARENFRSVEHLKRYTTLGMATDQGKTSNMNGLALMGALTDRTIPEVGTTTYRPPFSPVSLQTLAGRRSGLQFNPAKRLPLDDCHRADGAVFNEYGGWLRPAYYGQGDQDEIIAREVNTARQSVGLFDGSTLGKIEVIGPDAAKFLDFIFYNTVSTLQPGRCRYAFILTETGMIYDDGVLVRLSDNHFIVSCSSSHVAGVHGLLEDWRQDQFDPSRVFIHNATAHWATMTVTGPKSKTLLQSVPLGIDLDDAALPHMAMCVGHFAGDPVRIARVSFTGDRSYELSIRADRAEALWTALRQAGRPLDATLVGLESVVVMRAEKGFIIIGKDTDGLTRPGDLGLHGPLKNKKVEFIGRRSLLTADAKRDDRMQLVGLEVVDALGPLDIGAHGVERSGAKWRSLGYVTSTCFSPTLKRPIAMGLIERGHERMGDLIDIRHLGAIRQARIVPACAFDPEGERLHA